VSPCTHTFSTSVTGTHLLKAIATDGAGLKDEKTVPITVSAPPSGNAIIDEPFDSFTGWSSWLQRGSLTPTVSVGILVLQSSNHNGGVYKQFDTGGSGRRIDISGWWQSNPTVVNNQWAEVLVINGPDLPANGADVVGGGTVGNSNVVLIYKNDTYGGRTGWPMSEMKNSAPVVNVGFFTSAGSKATIVFKSGNAGGNLTGTRFDSVLVTGPGGTQNPEPTVSLATNGTSFDTGATIIGTATASDANGIARVDFYENGAFKLTDTASPYTYTIENAPAGSYALKAVAFDSGTPQASKESNVVNVSVTNPANPPPDVFLATNGTSFSVGATVIGTATASDANGIAKVEFYENNALKLTDTASPYTYTIANAAAGSYALKAIAFDNGTPQASQQSNIVDVSVTTQPGDPPPGALYQRRNFYGMHNLRDGGVEYKRGLDWTKHLVGRGGFAFDWVNDDTTWIKEVMDRNMIPAIRVQGGNSPSDSWIGIIASNISTWQQQADAKYKNKLIYLQLWNEPNVNQGNDFTPPDVFADFMVAAYTAVKQADKLGTLRVMTPGQNSPEYWTTAFTHNPQAVDAFDIWATHPYPKATPPHVNLHDETTPPRTVDCIDSYLLDLDVVAKFGRRGFPLMITEGGYGHRDGGDPYGYPKGDRELPCTDLNSNTVSARSCDYNARAFKNFYHNWPELIGVNPFLLENIGPWQHLEWVRNGDSTTAPDGSQIPTQGNAYPQYWAIKDIPKPPAGNFELYTGKVGHIKGRVSRKDNGQSVPYATLYTNGHEFGGPSLCGKDYFGDPSICDGGYEIRNVPIGTYILSADKKRYGNASKNITVLENQTITVDFQLSYFGKSLKQLYNLDSNPANSNQYKMDGAWVGQIFTTGPDTGFIKFASAKPNTDGQTLNFSLHSYENNQIGAQIGISVSGTLRSGDGAILIGAEWPDGQEPAVQPNKQYFLKVTSDKGWLFAYASDKSTYAGGYAIYAGRHEPSLDLFGTIRGLTPEFGTPSNLPPDVSLATNATSFPAGPTIIGTATPPTPTASPRSTSTKTTPSN
jgi:hypothetical protein